MEDENAELKAQVDLYEGHYTPPTQREIIEKTVSDRVCQYHTVAEETRQTANKSAETLTKLTKTANQSMETAKLSETVSDHIAHK